MQPPAQEDIKHHYAGIFLITQSGRIIGQQRDDIPTIDNPGKVAAFGGTVEAGEEPLEAVYRELVEEETNLQIQGQDIVLLKEDVAWRELTEEWEVRHFYYVQIPDTVLDTLEVYEGKGWAYISSPTDPLLIESWRPIIDYLFTALNLSK